MTISTSSTGVVWLRTDSAASSSCCQRPSVYAQMITEVVMLIVVEPHGRAAEAESRRGRRQALEPGWTPAPGRRDVPTVEELRARRGPWRAGAARAQW